MSEDGRNSVYLWLGTLTLFGAVWASLHFDLFEGISDTWLWPVLTVTIVANLVQTVWGFWQRRASNPKNPNRL
ncbi:hypothetical protein Q9K01_08080 [Qipengyuania sp. DY56-A-20]|uniref:Uncharacterized protein n=1 Tax=Qipengyuania benthica TaxID=3067651 RepID=A0ABT9H8I7_9SPHN|nr:hypothetical protein [Qipengyuania sp. DY56-A-20]MDP4539576.1 hypothetical protein [Qipengyuania sp. DY56-A-20]